MNADPTHLDSTHRGEQQSAADSQTGRRPRGVYSHALETSRVALVVLATIASLWALRWGEKFFIPCTVAICMTLWLMPLVDRLYRWRIPRSIGAALVLLSLLGALGFTGYALRDDMRGFAASLPVATRHARSILNEAAHDKNGIIHHLRTAFSDGTYAGRSRAAPIETTVDVDDAVVRGSTTALAVVADGLIVVFAIYLMLLSGDLFKRNLMIVVSRQVETGQLTRKRLTIEILNEIESQFQRYLGVLAVTNIAIGLLTWGAFALLGVEHAAVWGIAAAVLHIVPYVGPAVIAFAVFLVAALQFDSLAQAALVASTVIMIFCLIGMLFSTWLAGRASNMNSVAVFTGLMFWGWLWGIAGFLLGTPLLMAMKVIADRVDSLHWLGVFLSGAPKKDRKPSPSLADSTPAQATVAVALTESAAMPALADPSSLAVEAAAESMQVARDVQDDEERAATGDERKGLLAPLFPA